jgi:predicted dehydrogenase
MTAPVRVGVVGAGAIAQVAHLAVLAKLEGAEIVGLCDIDVAKTQALASRFGVPDVYDDIEDLLTLTAPDAVVICTPNHLHEIHVTTALAAGAHVMCERPVSLTADGLAAVRKARDDSGKIVLVGMNHRYRADVRAVRSFVSGGELGPLRAIRTGWYIFRPFGPGPGWRERRAESGVGVMLDLGLPLIDLSLWLAGTPQVRRVSGAFAGRPDSSVEDTACALIHCDDDLSVFIDVSWRHVGAAEKFWFEVMGDAGSARIGPLGVFKELHGTPVNVTPAGAPDAGDAFGASYREEWQRFLAMVRGDETPPDLDEQVDLHRTLDAIARSATEGRDIEL